MAKKAQAPDRTPPDSIGDVAFVFGKDHTGLHILRRRSGDAPVETGVLRPLQEGKPIEGEVVSLKRRRDLPLVYDVKTELEAARTAGEDGQARADDGGEELRAGEGPAQVATSAYRRGWEAIWGRSRGDRPN